MLKKFKLTDATILFLIALPGILHFILFKYVPLLGNIIAFQNYNIFDGIWSSVWVGLDNFKTMFSIGEFYRILENTIMLSLLSILIGFPAPLILALFLNEMRRMWLKRSIQTLLYLPHFLSWVIVGGIFINLLSMEGILNNILQSLGFGSIDLITNSQTFRGTLVSIGVWKEAGFGTIIYLAALAGINPSLYEAAMVDGAGRWRQMWNITLPSLMPAIVVLFLLRTGSVLDTNVEQVLIFINPLVRSVGEVIDTYVYRVGLLGSQFSLTTAIGLFKSVIGLLLIMGLNYLSKRTTGESIY